MTRPPLCGCWLPDPRASWPVSPTPGGLPEWISRRDFDVYVDEFTRHGFTGPLNWYRCFDRNWELTATPPAATIDIPALFIGGAADAALAYTPRDRAREVVTGEYREVLIDGAGHWLTEERPDEISRLLVDFPVVSLVSPVGTCNGGSGPLGKGEGNGARNKEPWHRRG